MARAGDEGDEGGGQVIGRLNPGGRSMKRYEGGGLGKKKSKEEEGCESLDGTDGDEGGGGRKE
ncbi:hypothetical protein BO78DRAFT_69367 [Aspergillus sclerotiicarbonarius CBS 121057]|uniref:Uncharacterized protein n=1 Tax=Aspergillus sclerotiicarbonarius (strain CBS 121057 / IBT 28362) TaxID=1448318 RepID=A0A319F7J1_ASPSB|nr:hypothetical protein BO78DRAFT_69367 [Aspergillus sclerotiicarbonarius CBS 121057]